MKIQVKKLTRQLRAKTAVDNISFEFSSGHIFGFIGPNGAGKTTTIKIMATLDNPTKGDVLFDGVSTVLYPEKIRRIIGYMPDELPSFADTQVWEYLDFYARAFGLKGDHRRRTLQEIQEFTGLGPIRDKFLNTLSKGMKQRVSLARALVHNPQVLVLDEPAAGLDPHARLELRELLKILAGQGKAILLSSHILSELQDVCDGAVIIEKGKILASGVIGELLVDAKHHKAPKPQEEMQQQEDEPILMATPIITLKIKTRDKQDQLVRKLLENPLVKHVEANAYSEVKLEFAGLDDQIPMLIKQLLDDGFPIVAFEKLDLGLQDIFLKITKGEIQ